MGLIDYIRDLILNPQGQTFEEIEARFKEYGVEDHWLADDLAYWIEHRKPCIKEQIMNILNGIPRSNDGYPIVLKMLIWTDYPLRQGTVIGITLDCVLVKFDDETVALSPGLLYYRRPR
jgi:hypothetical protein